MAQATNGSLPEWFPYVEAVLSYSMMVFVALTLPLYLIEIIILVRLRKTTYKSMFYRIFLVGAVVDMLALINNYLGAIFPARSWFIDFYLSKGTTVGHICLIIAWTTRSIQGCTVTILALNRATAVCSPIRHKRIWASKKSYLIFVFQLGIGCVIGSILIPQKFYWKNQDNGYYIQFDDMEFRGRFFMMAYTLDTIFVLIIIIINITMLIIFNKKYRVKFTPTNARLNDKQRHESNLSLVSSFTCLIEILYYIYIIYAFAINKYLNTRVFYLIYNALNNLYGAISAWLIFCFSKSIKLHVLSILQCRCYRNISRRRETQKLRMSSASPMHLGSSSRIATPRTKIEPRDATVTMF